MDLEKAFDLVPRKVNEWTLRRQQVSERLVTVVMSLYAESRSRVKTKLARGDRPWELLYADDLVLTAKSKKEVTDMFNRWKEGMKQMGLKIYREKTKSLVTGNKAREELVRNMAMWSPCCLLGVINGVTNDARV